MYGRYGGDQLGRFLAIVSLALLVAGLIVSGIIGSILSGIAVGCLVYSYFRMFSKKTNLRYQENVKYLRFKSRFTGWFRQQKDMFRQRKTNCFFKCPQCGQTVRVPRGKGKIKITCPKCRNSFIKNT